MVTQARKVWCPQCHKRHQLPPDVGGMTLRCRQCRFAFYLEDGLTTDPAIQDATAIAAKPEGPTSHGSSQSDSSLDLDDNYDDILEVLSCPDDPLAPPRAHAQPKSTETNQVDHERDREDGEKATADRSAQPVTRKRLHAYKNTRRILMLLSFLCACVACIVSWLIGRDLADRPLGNWERRMLYALGTPARLLPPQNINDEMLLPVNHVKLRGDFIELADRSDSYRDEFPNPKRDPAIVSGVPNSPAAPVRADTNKPPTQRPMPAAKNNPRSAKTNPRKRKVVSTKPTPPETFKPKAEANLKAKLQRPNLLLPDEPAPDPDEFFLHELARSPRFSAPLETLVALTDNRVAFFVKGKGYQGLGIAERDDQDWSIKPIELGTKLTVKGFDITENGKRIAIWSRDIIQFWEVEETGKAKLAAENASHTAEITQLQLTHDGKKAISGDRSGKLYVSVFETGQRTDSVEGFRTAIKCIVPKGTGGFVAMDQRGITRGVRAPIAPFAAHVSAACALSLNGTKLAFVRHNKEVVVADVGSRKVLETFKAEPTCTSLAFAGDIKHLITQDRTDVAVWDWRRNERLRVLRFQRNKNGKPVPVAIARDSKTVVVATGEGRNQISIYEMTDSKNEQGR